MSKFQKFLFFLASLIPGAGHMFLGFMKRGLLLMTIYFIDVGLSMILNGFLVFMPVIWFYCFFDSWNKFFLSDDEKKLVDDSFIFFYNAIPEELLPKSKRFSKKIPQKFYRYAGTALAFFGIVMLCRELRENLELPKIVEQILSFMPELLISLALIFIGIRLIAVKKKEIYDSPEDTGDDSEETNLIEPAQEIPFAVPLEENGKATQISHLPSNKNELDNSETASFYSTTSPELLTTLADDSLSVKADNESLKEEPQSEGEKEIELASQGILDDIDASLSPILDGIEKESGVEDIEYIWSSPAKSDNNPQ